MELEIQLKQREDLAQGKTNAARREGLIPCVVYAKGQVGQNCFVQKVEVETVLRKIQKGFLPTTRFVLKKEDGSTVTAIVKDIQYNVVNYQIIHIDFLELIEDRQVNVKVPLCCLRETEAAGVKAGGFLRQLMKHIKVRCLPKDMPTHFEIDVKDLQLRHSKRVADVAVPQEVRLLAKPKDVVVTCIK